MLTLDEICDAIEKNKTTVMSSFLRSIECQTQRHHIKHLLTAINKTNKCPILLVIQQIEQDNYDWIKILLTMIKMGATIDSNDFLLKKRILARLKSKLNSHTYHRIERAIKLKNIKVQTERQTLAPSTSVIKSKISAKNDIKYPVLEFKFEHESQENKWQKVIAAELPMLISELKKPVNYYAVYQQHWKMWSEKFKDLAIDDWLMVIVKHDLYHLLPNYLKIINLNTSTWQENTKNAFFLALQLNHTKTICIFLEHLACNDIAFFRQPYHASTEKFKSVVEYAEESNQQEIQVGVLEKIVSIMDRTEDYPGTIIHLAIHFKMKNALMHLPLTSHYDLCASNKEGLTAFELAIQLSYEDGIIYFLKYHDSCFELINQNYATKLHIFMLKKIETIQTTQDLYNTYKFYQLFENALVKHNAKFATRLIHYQRIIIIAFKLKMLTVAEKCQLRVLEQDATLRESLMFGSTIMPVIHQYIYDQFKKIKVKKISDLTSRAQSFSQISPRETSNTDSTLIAIPISPKQNNTLSNTEIFSKFHFAIHNNNTEISNLISQFPLHIFILSYNDTSTVWEFLCATRQSCIIIYAQIIHQAITSKNSHLLSLIEELYLLEIIPLIFACKSGMDALFLTELRKQLASAFKTRDVERLAYFLEQPVGLTIFTEMSKKNDLNILNEFPLIIYEEINSASDLCSLYQIYLKLNNYYKPVLLGLEIDQANTQHQKWKNFISQLKEVAICLAQRLSPLEPNDINKLMTILCSDEDSIRRIIPLLLVEINRCKDKKYFFYCCALAEKIQKYILSKTVITANDIRHVCLITIILNEKIHYICIRSTQGYAIFDELVCKIPIPAITPANLLVNTLLNHAKKIAEHRQSHHIADSKIVPINNSFNPSEVPADFCCYPPVITIYITYLLNSTRQYRLIKTQKQQDYAKEILQHLDEGAAVKETYQYILLELEPLLIECVTTALINSIDKILSNKVVLINDKASSNENSALDLHLISFMNYLGRLTPLPSDKINTLIQLILSNETIQPNNLSILERLIIPLCHYIQMTIKEKIRNCPGSATNQIKITITDTRNDEDWAAEYKTNLGVLPKNTTQNHHFYQQQAKLRYIEYGRLTNIRQKFNYCVKYLLTVELADLLQTSYDAIDAEDIKHALFYFLQNRLFLPLLTMAKNINPFTIISFVDDTGKSITDYIKNFKAEQSAIIYKTLLYRIINSEPKLNNCALLTAVFFQNNHVIQSLIKNNIFTVPTPVILIAFDYVLHYRQYEIITILLSDDYCRKIISQKLNKAEFFAMLHAEIDDAKTIEALNTIRTKIFSIYRETLYKTPLSITFTMPTYIEWGKVIDKLTQKTNLYTAQQNGISQNSSTGQRNTPTLRVKP